MKVFIVTGTPGTGKTTFAKKLAKTQKAAYIDVNVVIKENKFYQGYDGKLKTRIVNLGKVIKHLTKLIHSAKQNLVIDSHLSHYLSPRYVDTCYVTTCNLRTLKKRLIKRRYRQRKIRENLDAEILHVCQLEALLRKHKVVVVDTSGKRYKFRK